jgi:hypothetical protein
VLRMAGEALTSKDITQMILDAGLLQLTGKAPEDTISARLARFQSIRECGDTAITGF